MIYWRHWLCLMMDIIILLIQNVSKMPVYLILLHNFWLNFFCKIFFWRLSPWGQVSLLHLSECFRVFPLAWLMASYSCGTNFGIHCNTDGICPGTYDGMSSFYFWFNEGFGILRQPSLEGFFVTFNYWAVW